MPTEPVSPANPNGRLRNWLFAGLVVLGGLWSYRHSFRVPFILDDIPCIVENGALDSLIPDPRRVPYGVHRRPVGQFTLAVNFAIHQGMRRIDRSAN